MHVARTVAQGERPMIALVYATVITMGSPCASDVRATFMHRVDNDTFIVRAP